MVLYRRGVFDDEGEGDALRDRWVASERDGKVLRLAAGDGVGDDKGIKRFNDAAAAIFLLLIDIGGNSTDVD